MQNYFLEAMEFITEDNRQYRARQPITLEFQTKKHRALFPDELVAGKRILDLGSCSGATGYWCLRAGAEYYTGIEVQEEYAALSRELLGKHFPGKFTIHTAPIETWLEQNTEQYDIVSALGVLYVFVDYYSILKYMARAAKETIVIEHRFHWAKKMGADFLGVQFWQQQPINLATEKGSLLGRGTSISPKGLEWLLEGFGFETPGMIFPEQIVMSPDIYNTKDFSDLRERPRRYMMRFTKTDKKAKSLSEDLQGAREGNKEIWLQ